MPVTLYSIEQAKDALLTLMINYDLEQQEGQERARLLDQGMTLIAYEGGNEMVFYINEVKK